MESKKGKIIILLLMILITIGNVVLAIDEEAMPEETESMVQKENIEEVPEVKSEIVKAKVIEAGEAVDVQEGEVSSKKQKVKIKIIEGEFKDKTYESTYELSYDIDNKILANELKKNDKIFVELKTQGNEVSDIIVQDVIRHNSIIFMIIIFLMLILIIGGKKGFKAILGLLFTIVAIYFIMIKSIYNGYNPIMISILTSTIIIAITFIIIGGINKKSLTASIGTSIGVIFAGLIALIFGYFTRLSGAGQEEAIMLSINAQNIVFNFRELLFAGIMISSLGACMDVGMSIASALEEIRLKSPEITEKELFRSGMNIGRDVIGTMINTLILAYVGGALNLILLFMACDMNIIEIINKETIATDVVSAIAGSMGIVFTIPVTSFVYSFICKDKLAYKKKTSTRLEGKRTLKL